MLLLRLRMVEMMRMAMLRERRCDFGVGAGSAVIRAGGGRWASGIVDGCSGLGGFAGGGLVNGIWQVDSKVGRR